MSSTERRAQPQRTCIGCRQRRPQGDLTRLVIGSAGEVTASRTAPGRGAWLCADRRCGEQAMRTKAFQRAFRRRLDEAVLHQQLAPLTIVNTGTAAGEER